MHYASLHCLTRPLVKTNRFISAFFTRKRNTSLRFIYPAKWIILSSQQFSNGSGSHKMSISTTLTAFERLKL